MTVEYKLLPYNNPDSDKYKFAVVKKCLGFFDYHYCTKADVEKYKNNLSELYRISKDNK